MFNQLNTDPARERFYDKWISDECDINYDIQCALTEKSEGFNPRMDIRALKALGDEFEDTQPKGAKLPSLEGELLLEEL